MIKLAPEPAPRTRAAMKAALVPLDQIDFSANARPTRADKVSDLVSSIRLLGLQYSPTVIGRDGRYLLVAGRHRVEAMRVIGKDPIPVRIVDFDDVEARLWTISENLHRNDLTALQRNEQIAEYARLTKERQEISSSEKPTNSDAETPVKTDANAPLAVEPDKVRQVGAVSGGRGNEGGNRAAARGLGLPEQTVRRATQVDSITPETKEAARSAGLDRNQSALLKVASYADDDQVGAVAEIAKARAEKAIAPRAATPLPPRPSPLRNLENIAAGSLALWIKETTPNDRLHVIDVLERAAAILRSELQAEQAA